MALQFFLISCIDINECEEDYPCNDDMFCVNTEGSYSCEASDEYKVTRLKSKSCFCQQESISCLNILMFRNRPVALQDMNRLVESVKTSMNVRRAWIIAKTLRDVITQLDHSFV